MVPTYQIRRLLSIEKLLFSRGLAFLLKFNFHLFQSFCQNPKRCLEILSDQEKFSIFSDAVRYEPIDSLIKNSKILQKRLQVMRTERILDQHFIYIIDEKVLNSEQLKIRGWSISQYNIDRIELHIDGILVQSQLIKDKRPDVTLAFPDEKYNKNTGFVLYYNYLQEDRDLNSANIVARFIDHLNFSIDVQLNIHEFTTKSGDIDYEDFDFETNYDCYLQKEKEYINLVEENLNIQSFQYKPLISLIIPTYNVDAKWLQETLNSVHNQLYTNWEICIYDDGSSKMSTLEYLDQLLNTSDPKIKITLGANNRGIALASNQAIDMASGDYIALLDHDDMLPPIALYEIVKCLNDHEADFIYTDEDKIDENSNRSSPHFKSDFNLFLLRCQNYICHFSVIKKSIGDQVGWFREGYDGAQDHDLFLRISDITHDFHHIDRVLYHWRTLPTSTSLNINAKTSVTSSGEKAVRDHLNRNSLNAIVKEGKWFGAYDIYYFTKSLPSVTIVIPFRDKKDLLQNCVSSILDKTTYKNYRILLVSNNSTSQELFDYLHYLTDHYEFIDYIEHNIDFNFSALMNHAISLLSSDHVLLLNNDIEVISSRWLSQMVGILEQKNVAAVGAKLLYPDLTIQHAGVITGIGGVAGHSHKYMLYDDNGYFLRPHLDQNLSACTGACILIKTHLYKQINGMNENELKVAFNDVDLCLRLLQLGYDIIYSAKSILIHYESKSRGYDDTIDTRLRFNSEVQYMKSTFKDLPYDRFYNRNLTLTNENFSLSDNPNHL